MNTKLRDHGSVSVRVCQCLLCGVRCLEEAQEVLVEVRYSIFGLSFKSGPHELMPGASLWFPASLATI